MGPGVELDTTLREIVDRIGAGDAYLSVTAPCAAAGGSTRKPDRATAGRPSRRPGTDTPRTASR